MALAVPPVSCWPLAWISLAPLYVLCVDAPAKRAALYGLAWGIGFYGAALFWITHLHPLTWMGVPWAGSIAIAAFAWVVVTGWGTACVVLWSLMVAKVRGTLATRVILAVALWGALEFLRSLSPLDWVSLALTQSPHNLVVLHLGRLSGPTTVVAVIVGVNCLFAEAWRHPHSRLLRKTSLGLALGLIASAHLVGAGLYWLPLQIPASAAVESLHLGLIQGNVPTREKLTPAGLRRAIAAYTEGYQALVDQGADAVLTPEGAIPAPWRFPNRSPLIEAVRAAGVPLWLGTFMPVAADPSRLTQSLIEVGPQANVQARYNKIKLVPLGEYIPLENLVGRLIGRLSPLDSYLVAGDRHQQFQSSLGTAIVSICYESAYSSILRQQAAAGGEFMLTAANNDPYPPWMMMQHHALDVIRAIESDRWALRATNTGISGVVDNRGRTRWVSTPNTYSLHFDTIYLRQTKTLYVHWGDWLLPLLVVLSLGGWAYDRRKDAA
ncbi:apolipoprotein N-acyltransferase [filamentous cyanobacterium CCP5]|nr:apolipoprotein N-acyltransferase [filamentous cyanobacterium CCP5]